MKQFLVFLLFVFSGLSCPSYAQTAAKQSSQTVEVPKAPEAPAAESFFAKGTIAEVDREEKVLQVKIEDGLELTFHTNEATGVREGEGAGSFENLVEGRAVEMEYFYNEDYEKVARVIRLVSAGKNGPPPA